MDTFLVPIKVLIDMGVRTKSTYVAAMEGIELSMIKFLDELGYDYKNKKFDGLYKLPGAERLALQRTKHEEFIKNPKIGIGEFAQYISKKLDQYFDNIYVGRVRDVFINDDAIVEVNVSALLHSKITDRNKLAAEVELEDKLDVLALHGLEFEKVKRMMHYQLKDNDKNRKIIEDLMNVRGAYGISFLIKSGYIREFSFRFHAKDIHKWSVYVPAKTEQSTSTELSDCDLGNIRQCLTHIPHALRTAFDFEGIRETCCYVAEGQFSDLCRHIGYNGVILKNLDERYREERESNAQINDIVDIIGSEFPAELCEEVVTETKSELMRFFISKMHTVVQDYKITRLGDIELDVRWIGDPDDLIYYIDEEELMGKSVIPLENIDQEFEIISDDRGVMILCDSDKNRQKILEILSNWNGMKLRKMNVEYRDDLDGAFSIVDMNVVVENIINVFNR